VPRPLVSVVTVAYNALEPLRRTLDSVRAQRWDAIEQIVMDGGSADGTVELLLARDREIALWRSERDRGIYDAMNKGLAQAIGEYVLFLNSGDVLQGKVLFPGRDFGRLLPVQALDFWGRPRMLRLRDIRLGMPYCHQGILFRNSGLVPFDTSYAIAADYEFLLANLSRAGLGPPQPEGSACVVFDTSGVSNRRVLQRDLEAARIIRRRYGRYRWMKFRTVQGTKLLVRWLVARLGGPGRTPVPR
jgi:glycosyltransferase involved in cell wall biosynthesis